MNFQAHLAQAEPFTPDPWPPLMPLDAPDLPRLDPDTLGGWAGDFANALAAFTETPLELPAGLVLGALATAAARRVQVCVKQGYFEPCNLWLLPALAPGNRKSSVQSAASAPLLAWERDQAERSAGAIAANNAERDVALARGKELRGLAAKSKVDLEAKDLARQASIIEQAAPDEMRPPQLWTSDATPEKLGMLLADQGERMAWLSAEAGFFELVGGRYSGGVPNLDLMLKAHAGDAERVDRGSRPSVYLRQPLLTMALSPQPDVLRGLAAKPGFRGRGLLGRFLYFLPGSPLGFRTLDGPPIPEPITIAYAAGVRAMLDLPPWTDDQGRPGLHTLRLSAGARAAWADFAAHTETTMRPGGDFEHATDWAGKAPGAAARLAGVLHAAAHAHGGPMGHDISTDTMERALAIVALSARHALAAFALMDADNGLAAATRVWRWIERKRPATFTTRDVWQGVKGAAGFNRAKDVAAALDVLAERGYVAPLPVADDGRPGRPPSDAFVVRPDLVAGWR